MAVSEASVSSVAHTHVITIHLDHAGVVSTVQSHTSDPDRDIKTIRTALATFYRRSLFGSYDACLTLNGVPLVIVPVGKILFVSVKKNGE